MLRPNEKLLNRIRANAIVTSRPGRPDMVTLRCSDHGGCTSPYEPTVGDCEECNLVWLIVREGLLYDMEGRGDKREQFVRAVANEVQAERAGTSHFQKEMPKVLYLPDSAEFDMDVKKKERVG